MKACIVTGTRHGTAEAWHQRITDALSGYDVVIEGGARGIDFIAGSVARATGKRLTIMPADWDQHGRAAGPKRNQLMLEELLSHARTDGAEIAVLAFHDDLPNSKGTRDMVTRALAANVHVEVFA